LFEFRTFVSLNQANQPIHMKAYSKLLVLFFILFGVFSTISLVTNSHKSSFSNICIKTQAHHVSGCTSLPIPSERNLISFRFHHGIDEDITIATPIRISTIILSLPEPVGELTSKSRYYCDVPDELPIPGDFLNLSLLHAPPFSC
jgi:hypothetical protein